MSGRVTECTAGKQLRLFLCTALAVALIAVAGCSKQSDSEEGAPDSEPSASAAGAEHCDFKGGPEAAAVKVVAFYPGRHEDTLAAVKSLLETFKGKVQVEIVDWRHEAGIKRRNAAGLVCAGITINGKYAFDLEVDGQETKVLFERGIGGEWTKADLEAGVQQELEVAGRE